MILELNDVLALCTKIDGEEKKEIESNISYGSRVYFYEIGNKAFDVMSSTCKDGYMLAPVVLTEHIIALKRANMYSDGISIITDAEIKRDSIIRLPNCIVSSQYWIHGICGVQYEGDSMNFDFVSYDMRKVNAPIRAFYDVQYNMTASYMQPYTYKDIQMQLNDYANEGGNKQ